MLAGPQQGFRSAFLEVTMRLPGKRKRQHGKDNTVKDKSLKGRKQVMTYTVKTFGETSDRKQEDRRKIKTGVHLK